MKEYVAKVTTISYDFLGIPLMFLLSNGLDLKIGGIWLAVGIANMVNSVFFFWKGG
jgi:MATE family multidrug resistance protein